MTDTKHDKFPSSIWVLVYNVAWDMGSWVKDKPTYNRATEYVRADLVAERDAALSALAYDTLRNTREITRLRDLLKARDGEDHSEACWSDTMRIGSFCTCGHDAVAAYFSEIGE